MDTIYEQIKGFLEIIWVRGQNIEIFIKNVKFQDLTLCFVGDRITMIRLATELLTPRQ